MMNGGFGTKREREMLKDRKGFLAEKREWGKAKERRV